MPRKFFGSGYVDRLIADTLYYKIPESTFFLQPRIHVNSGSTGMIEETAVPCPYNVILGRETALPSPNLATNFDVTGNDIMYFFRKQIAILLVVVACCTLTISCSDNRAAQCTKFTEIVAKGNTLIEIKKDSNDAATTKNLAKDLNQIAKQLEALQITDTTLKEMQGPSVKSFREIGQALGDIGKALEAGNQASTSIKGREQIQAAQADIITAGQRANQAAANQDALTSKLINYCKGDRS